MPVLTLAIAKQILNVDYATHDGLIGLMLTGVEDWTQRHCGVAFESSSVSQDIDGGGFSLWPTQRPVSAIASITDTVTSSLMDAGDYHLVESMRITRDDAERWDSGSNRWRLAYTGGYASVPDGLVDLMYQLVARRYHSPGGRRQQAAAGYGTTWEPWLTSDQRRFLRTYRRVSGGGFVG